ncbi:MAG TPA: response regulator [Kofleriaceae bacterium]|nr:response regulator [Kofleriaceae bacterium]
MKTVLFSAIGIPSRATNEVDPRVLEETFRELVYERLRFYAAFAACWSIVWAIWFRIDGDWTTDASLVNVGFCALAALGFGLAPRVRGASSSAITSIGVALGLVQLAVQAYIASTNADSTQFYIAALSIFVAGALLLHTMWVVVYTLAGSTILLAIVHLPGHTLSSDAMLLGAACSTCALLHLIGRRYVVYIETLRQRDRHQHHALEKALSDARRELADRERAEAERARVISERERLREQLIQAQKMEALGTLAGGFAHDMNNVLGGILASAELLREESPSFHEELDDLIASTRRGAELTRNLLGFARRGQYRKERVDLEQLVGSVVRLLARTVPKGVVFDTVATAPRAATDGDPSLITQALVNLCLNAVDAMRGVGRLTIGVGQASIAADRAAALGVSAGEFATLTVTDTGCGMSADVMAKIFEPFFTTKELGHGTGLGLAMVYGTLRSSGGAVEVKSELGKGSTFTMYLRASEAPSIATLPQARPRPSVAHAGTVLVVDDDPRIRRGARRILEGRGYQVHEAGDGAEALAIFEQRRGELQLVVLDMAMPVMSGAECFERLRAHDPDIRVLLASGYTIEEDARGCLAAGAAGFLDKPYTADAFAHAVAAAIRGEPIAIAADAA